MSDDIISKFTGRHGKPPASGAKPALVVNHEVPGREAYEAYEAFSNEVRATSVEIRCHRSEISYFMQYARMGVITFHFRKGDRIFFTCDGHAVMIVGRNLRAIVMALRLHTCGSVQDFSPDTHIQPEPVDPTAPFVESISVEILRPAPRGGDEAKSGKESGKA
jgi:hypothetical protein